jgi:4-coumarate--CoA ligase
VGIPGMQEGDYAAALVVKNALLTHTSEELCNVVNAKLAERKQIRGGIFFVDQLPRTTSGKVLRRKAREMAIEMYAKANK